MKILVLAFGVVLAGCASASAQPIGQLPSATSASGTQLPCAAIGLAGVTKGCTPAQIVSAGGGSSSSNTVNAGTGLTGGGVVSSNPTLSVQYGTSAGTAAQGNDTRITGALQATTAVSTYAPLVSPALTGSPTAPTQATGDNTTKIATDAFVLANAASGGASSVSGDATGTNSGGNIPITVTKTNGVAFGPGATAAFGTASGTIAQGNDSRILNAMQGTNNLSELTNLATARTNLGVPVGNSGAVLGFLNGNNTHSGTNAFTGITTVPTASTGDSSTNAASTAFVAGNASNLTLGNTQPINSSLTLTGAPPHTATQTDHLFVINETHAPASEYGFIDNYAFYTGYNAGHSGQRNSMLISMNVSGSTSDTTGAGQHDYVALSPIAQVNNPLHPGSTGSANAIGQFYAMNPVVNLTSGSSPSGEQALVAAGGEVDVDTSAPLVSRQGWLVSGGGSLTEGSGIDCAFCVGNGSWKNGLVIFSTSVDGVTPAGVNPLDTSVGCAFCTVGTVSDQDAINLNTLTPSRHLITMNGGLFQVTYSGSVAGSPNLNLRGVSSDINLGSFSTSGGQPQINFFTSGHGAGSADVSLIVTGGTATASQGVLSIAAGTIVDSAGLRPGAANTGTIGASSYPYQTAYFQTAPTITSDKRYKVEAANVVASKATLRRVLKAISYRAYMMKATNDSGRIRFGVYAQDIAAAFTKAGLKWQDYAVVEHDESSDRWSVSYTELENLRHYAGVK